MPENESHGWMMQGMYKKKGNSFNSCNQNRSRAWSMMLTMMLKIHITKKLQIIHNKCDPHLHCSNNKKWNWTEYTSAVTLNQMRNKKSYNSFTLFN